MEPEVGVEPTTTRLQGGSSAVEPLRQVAPEPADAPDLQHGPTARRPPHPPTSPAGTGGLENLEPPDGTAPSSRAYQARALLLSYSGILAGPEGVEPSPRGPKPRTLPLRHGPVETPTRRPRARVASGWAPSRGGGRREGAGAERGNRTPVVWMGTRSSAIELPPRTCHRTSDGAGEPLEVNAQRESNPRLRLKCRHPAARPHALSK